MKIKRMKTLFLNLCILFICCMAVGCGKDDTPKTYTITLATDYGKAMEEVEVRVYTDTTKADIVAAGSLDEGGNFSFQAANAEGNVIYFEGDFVGYETQEYYEIEGADTEIVLKTDLLTMDELDGITFELGDVFADVTVTAADGKEYQLSDLLKEKKAVMLNFWYLNCQPCKMEFPYLQEAYSEYKDVIEVLAMNPVDGTDDKITAYKTENGFDFPMAVCDNEWESYIDIKAYPTTIIIDRYGIVSYIHEGTITDKETFVKIFEFFTSEDYQHTTIKRLSELE